MAIALLSLVGALLAFYLLAASLGWTPPPPCGSGECATVQSSEYATIGPVPVSAIGVAGYLALLVLALLGLGEGLAASRAVALLIFAGAVGGVLFSAYLTYLEAVVIGAWCRYCVASALVMAAIFGCAWPEARRVRGARSAEQPVG